MKKHLHKSLRALFLSLAVLLSLPMLAEQVEINGINYELVAKVKQATVKAKSSGYYSGEIVIPESVEHQGTTYSVTSIGDGAFGNCSGLTSVTISNSVTSIGGGAFFFCKGLTSVTIPNSVERIGYEAFKYCSGLNSVTIGNSVTSIDGYAFHECSGLTSVTIPNSVTSIGRYAFSYCSGLTSVTIPNSVTSIGEYAFSCCSGLTSVTIPNSVTSIGIWAFSGCSGLTSVTIPNGVTSIGAWAFSGCSGLTSVTIPNSVTSINTSAFKNCSGLTSVTIGSGVKNIYSSAFANCPELLDVYCYAEKVPSTESDAFEGSYPEYANLHVPDGSKSAYKTTTPWSGFGTFNGLSGVELPQEYSLKVSHVGYATLFLDFNADIPANVQAYVTTKVDGNRMKMTRVEGVLPANTSVIILANEGTYTFAESDATPATIGDNLLEGTIVTTQISADPAYSYYVLSNVDGVVGMYLAKLTEGKFQNNANKAYLKVNKGDLGIFDDEVDSSVEQLSRRLVFDFGDETGIDEVKTENANVKTAVYDLSGRRVQKAQKGIYIQNGKLMVK